MAFIKRFVNGRPVEDITQQPISPPKTNTGYKAPTKESRAASLPQRSGGGCGCGKK